MGASVWALRNGDLRRNWTRIAVGHLAGLSPPEFAVAAVRQEWKRKRVRERAQVLGRGCVHGRGHGPYGERHGDDRGRREHVSADGHVHARDYDCDHVDCDRADVNAYAMARPPLRRTLLLPGEDAVRRAVQNTQKKFDRQGHGHGHSSGRRTARVPTPPAPTACVPRAPRGSPQRQGDQQGQTTAGLRALRNRRPGQAPGV